MNLLSKKSSITESAIDKKVLALSWNIATEPKLYRELAQNPYSPKVAQIILERFPDFASADVIKAIVLAEPEGKYDRNFRHLSKTLQEDLSEQKETADKIHKRLHEYYKKHARELRGLSKELVYNSLSLVVFETIDLREIEQKYSQLQRREFKLSIVNLVKENPSASETFYEKPDPVRLLAKVVFAVFSCLLIFYLFQVVENKTHNLQAKKQKLPIATQKANIMIPVRLKIPIINVDALVEYVGITSNGAMEVPNNTVDVGWFALGPHPGEKGSSVIAGHFDAEDDKPGVFNNLNKLKKGDKVYVENGKGTTIIFVVRDKRTYDPGYAKEVFRQSDKAHLNLITCDGTWDGSKKSYTKRLVVFADILALDSK